MFLNLVMKFNSFYSRLLSNLTILIRGKTWQNVWTLNEDILSCGMKFSVCKAHNQTTCVSLRFILSVLPCLKL